ncbi:MAG: RNA polymerase factor sigma-54 [bacterium]|nr:RNA polymerase factor sigma-54 [bacterium]
MMQELSQRLRQELRLTPQLLELVKILQLPRMELQQLITHEIEINPFLTEELFDEQDELETEMAEPEAELPKAQELDYEYFFHDEWKGSGNDFSRKSEDDGDYSFVEAYSQPKTLREHLMTQVHLAFETVKEISIGEYITDSLSEDGLLEAEIADIAEALNCTNDEIEGVLKKYTLFDPIGIGSRNVRECLMTQLENMGRTETIEYMIIRDFFEEFMTNKIYKIMAKVKVTENKLQKAIEEIKKLNPRPANGEWGKTGDYVIPDIIIERKNEDFICSINMTQFPEVHLNKKYVEMLKNKDHMNKEEERFLKQRLNSAIFMLEGIHKRNRTLMKITERIIMMQKDFLEFGISALKPMILADIAEYVGMHESTISRALESKYVDTPQGIFPFKFFFSRSIKTETGDTSSTNVKDIIKQIIENENSSNPLTDGRIVDILKDKYSISLARRTVAKYREQCDILPTVKRKKYFKEVK